MNLVSVACQFFVSAFSIHCFITKTLTEATALAARVSYNVDANVGSQSLCTGTK